MNRLNPEPSGWTGGKATSGLNNTRFMSSPCYLFAYGTLLTGTPDGAINRLIGNFMRPQCRAYFYGRLHDLGAYPGATPSPNRQDKVWGQVFSVVGYPGRVLSVLDAYEGYQPDFPHQSEFVRQTTTAMQLPCQRPITASVYYYNGHLRGATRLLSGDYVGTLQATGRHLVPIDNSQRSACATQPVSASAYDPKRCFKNVTSAGRARRTVATKSSGTILNSCKLPRRGEPQGWGE